MKDLTKGYPAKVVLMFALPLMMGNIFQQLYNMADSKIVSFYVGETALAAVGATGVVSNTLIGLINGLTQGFSILIAKSYGAKDHKEMRKYVAGTMILTLISAIVLTLFGEGMIELILKWLETPGDIFSDALSYVRIILLGIGFTALYNMSANMLRAVGDSKTPLYCLLIGVVLNVILDYWFVGILDWKVQGAAYATILAQWICSFSCAGFVLFKFRVLLPHREDWYLQKEHYKELLTTGLAMGMMGCIVNMGTVILQGAINGLGTTIVVAHTAARRLFDVLTVMLYTIGVAMTTFVSQNLGAGRYDRIRQGVRHSLMIEVVIAIVLMIVCYIFGRPIATWLASTDQEAIISAAVMYIRVSVSFFLVLGPLFVLRCTLQGLGRKMVPIISSIMEMAVKVLSAMFLVPKLKYPGVALTEPISWVIMTIILAIAYFSRLPKEEN